MNHSKPKSRSISKFETLSFREDTDTDRQTDRQTDTHTDRLMAYLGRVLNV